MKILLEDTVYYFILHVLHNPDNLESILSSWNDAGVKGITVLRSIGFKGLSEQAALREDMPLLPTLQTVFESGETLNRTIFTVVEGEALVDKLITATEAISGDLNEPGTGILVVMPVARALGLNRAE